MTECVWFFEASIFIGIIGIIGCIIAMDSYGANGWGLYLCLVASSYIILQVCQISLINYGFFSDYKKNVCIFIPYRVVHLSYYNNYLYRNFYNRICIYNLQRIAFHLKAILLSIKYTNITSFNI